MFVPSPRTYVRTKLEHARYSGRDLPLAIVTPLHHVGPMHVMMRDTHAYQWARIVLVPIRDTYHDCRYVYSRSLVTRSLIVSASC